MAKAKPDDKFKRTDPKEVDPKVKRDLGPGHVTRPDPGPAPSKKEV